MTLSDLARPRRPAFRLPLLLAAAMLLLISAASFARAADVVYPLGMRVGLVPADGMKAGRAGFEAEEKKTIIMIAELPPQAYDDMEKTMTIEALSGQGLEVDKREPVSLTNGKGVLVSGHQSVNGARYRKWLLLASVSDVTALVVAQAPDAEKESYSDAAMRSTITSVAARPNPLDEQLSMIPFKISDLSGFRIVRVIAGTAVVMTSGPKDAPDADEQPQFVIAVANGLPVEAAERENFAKQTMGLLSNFKDMHLTFSEPLRIGGLQGYELRADAKDQRKNADVSIVQWIRFGTGGYMQMVGVSPKDKWADNFPHFRAIRDGVDVR